MARREPASSPLRSADSRFVAAFVLVVAFLQVGKNAAVPNEPDEHDHVAHRRATVDASSSDPFSSRGLFPPVHEYDALAIDPISMFGSPLGGFSRATAARLGSIPLHLPLVSLEAPPDDPAYLQVRDEAGRLFACRVYHQDELEPSSWNDGLFDAPRLVQPAVRASNENDEPVPDAASTASVVSSASSVAKDDAVDQTTNGVDNDSNDAPTANGVTFRDRGRGGTRTGADPEAAEVGLDGTIVPTSPGDGNTIPPAAATKMAAANKNSAGTSTEDADGGDGDGASISFPGPALAISTEEVEDRLNELVGTCAHIHLGYWSTEWCYKSTVRQYHVSVDTAVDAVPAGLDVTHHLVRISELTRLGQFERRKIDLVNEPSPQLPSANQDNRDNHNDRPPNPLAGGRKELARVLDVHGSGDVCDVTGHPRTALVQILCCDRDVMQGESGGQQASPHPPEADRHQTLEEPPLLPVVALHGVYEDSDRLCNYVVTVCTSLLCADEGTAAKGQRTGRSAAGDGGASARKVARRALGEIESVRDILDRSLGERCLDTTTDGWWSYSYCHGDRITQYHEVVEGKKSRSGVHYTATTVEAEHLLGLYQEASVHSYPDDEEWRHVVNATGRSRHGGGSGTYFEMTYTDGDICDHSDVTDAAVVAGGTGHGGPLSRGSTVRFFCGKSYLLAVNEDSTCHYVVEVTVPDLCDHPLFMEPILKKQIVKCCLVDNGHPVEHLGDGEDSEFEQDGEK